MKSAISILILALLLGSCATTKTQLPTDNIDELLGVAWINPEYDRYVGKVVWNVDGTCDVYSKASDKYVKGQDEYILKEKWMEPDGSIFIKLIWTFCNTTRYILLRLLLMMARIKFLKRPAGCLRPAVLKNVLTKMISPLLRSMSVKAATTRT